MPIAVRTGHEDGRLDAGDAVGPQAEQRRRALPRDRTTTVVVGEDCFGGVAGLVESRKRESMDHVAGLRTVADREHAFVRD